MWKKIRSSDQKWFCLSSEQIRSSQGLLNERQAPSWTSLWRVSNSVPSLKYKGDSRNPFYSWIWFREVKYFGPVSSERRGKERELLCEHCLRISLEPISMRTRVHFNISCHITYILFVSSFPKISSRINASKKISRRTKSPLTCWFSQPGNLALPSTV